MGTTTQLVLDARLSEAIGDFLEFDTTTNITTDTSVISTTLRQYDDGQDDYFNEWWLYITEGNNITVERKISDYDTATGTLTVYGANLSAEAGAVTCRIGRFKRGDKVKAIVDAIREIYPSLYKPIEDRTLVTGNFLPDGHFEWWSSSSALKFYTASNVTLAQTTTAGLYRGPLGSTSAKATASADNGYFYISSDSYPRLLGLQDKTVSAYVWAHPEVADEAAIVIYTKQAAGSTQTLTSSTSNPAGEFTLLELEDQTLNDDLAEVQIRFKVASSTKYAYFDAGRVVSQNLNLYILPEDAQDGHINQVYVQTSGYSDNICDDINPRFWEEVYGFQIIDDATYKYLWLPYFYSNERQIKLIGTMPLETLTADDGTISLSGERINLLVAKAAQIFFERHEQPPSSEDVSRFTSNALRWERKYKQLLLQHRMSQPSQFMNLPVY